MSQSPHDSRLYPRVPFAVEVSLESEHNFYTGITDNISEGGIFVAMTHPPAIGTRVTFELVLGEESYTVAGEVRWIRTPHSAGPDAPEGCGIRWAQIDEKTAEAVKRFTSSRDTLFYDEE